MRARFVIAVAAAVLLVSCHKQQGAKEDPNAVATVNGEVLSRADFEHELSRELQGLANEGPPTPEQLDPVKRALLQSTIERMVLLQAARQQNIAVTPEEVDRGVLRMTSDYPAGGLNAALAQGQLSMAELKQKTAALLTVEKLFQANVYARIAVTEDELRAYYEQHQDDFSEPEQVRAAQIVVKDLDEAKRVQAQLKAGKKFADLARKYSLSADAKVGGDLGFFPRGVMPPQFDEVCFKLGVNQVSDVVVTDYGFHLFKLLEKRPARKRDLAEVRGEIETKLLEQKRSAAQQELVKSLKDKADIHVNEAALQSVTAKLNPSPRVAEP